MNVNCIVPDLKPAPVMSFISGFRQLLFLGLPVLGREWDECPILYIDT